MSPLEISQRKEEGIIILAVKGKINVETAPMFRKSLQEQMDNDKNKIVINMKELDYLSSAGIREFMLTYHQIKNTQEQIVLCRLQDAVRNVFKVTRLDSYFEIFDTEEIAFQHFNKYKKEISTPEVNESEVDKTGKILDLNHRSENNTIIVFVKGKVNAVTASMFEKYLTDLTDKGGKRLVIDMSELVYLSCSGLRVLLQTANKINALKGDILLMGLKKTKNHVREVIEVAKFDVIIKTFANKADAFEALLNTTDEPPVNKMEKRRVSQFLAKITGKWKTWLKLRRKKTTSTKDILPDLKTNILDLDYCRKKNAVIVSVKGKVNTVTASMFEKYLSDLIAKGETKLVIDLSELEFISSSGLRVLLLTANKIKALQGDMMLIGLEDTRDNVRELMEVAQFDDTMVKIFDTRADAYKELLSTTGEPLVKIIKPAIMENLANLIKPAKECAQRYGFGPERINEIELALEEALVNVISYAYPDPDAAGNVEICCQMIDKGLFIIEIKDSGIPFDSLQKDDPDLTAEISERKVGGLGIFLIKQFMDDVKYRREQGHNILSFIVVKKDK